MRGRRREGGRLCTPSTNPAPLHPGPPDAFPHLQSFTAECTQGRRQAVCTENTGPGECAPPCTLTAATPHRSRHNRVELQRDGAQTFALRLQIFGEVFSREHQLIRADPRRHTYLACGLLMRGSATISDINRNIAKIRPSLKMAHWNTEVGPRYTLFTSLLFNSLT